MKPKSIKFVFEGQESKIKLVYRGQTTIALIVIGKEDMTYKDRCERVYCGTSTCSPRDTYNVNEGIKMACRHALSISDYNCKYDCDERERVIYREIRKVLGGKIQTTKFQVVLDTIFEE